jgi:competence protein ComEC
VLPGIATAVLLGNLGVHALPELPPPGALAAFALAIPVLLRFPHVRWLAWAVVGFAWTTACAHLRLDDRWMGTQADVAISGWIDDFPTHAPDRTIFSLSVFEPKASSVPRRLRLSWYDAPPGLEPGAHLEIVARLRSPRGLMNPDGFDYEQWLFVEEFGATGYVRSGRVVAGASQTLAQRWLKLRATLAARIDRAAQSASGGTLLVALSLGERYGFTEQHWVDLRRTGTSHLVSISGLHISLIAVLTFWIVRSVCLFVIARYAFGLAALASAATAFVYTALAGFDVPAERSLIMVLVALAIVASRRVTASFHGIAAALVIVLAVEPLATLTVSFWLSFTAVVILLLLASRKTLPAASATRAHAVIATLWRAIPLQWHLTLGLTPWVVAYFAELSLVSPLVNLVAIPIFSFVMIPLSLLAAATAAFDGADLGLVRLAAMFGDVFWTALHAAAGVQWAAVAFPASSTAALLVAGIGGLLALPVHPLPGRRLVWLALAPMLVTQPPRPAPGEATALVFDVGHGLAVLVETAQHSLLYDAGPVLRSGFDTGNEIIVPALARRGVAELDVLIVSHSDSDHAGGAHAVRTAYPEARVLKGPDVASLSGATCVAGERWLWDGVEFEILHPAAEFAARGNDSSCVLRVVTRWGSLLLPGDVEGRGERALADHASFAADVVLVPHHGSATSSSPAFVTGAASRYALVSAGYANRWGLPRPDVAERWARAGAAVLVTADTGAMTLAFRVNGLDLNTERLRRRRYWHAESSSLPGEEGTGAL